MAGPQHDGDRERRCCTEENDRSDAQSRPVVGAALVRDSPGARAGAVAMLAAVNDRWISLLCGTALRCGGGDTTDRVWQAQRGSCTGTQRHDRAGVLVLAACTGSGDARRGEMEDDMALLNVSTLSEDTIAAPGNNAANYVVVSVTDAAGVPVTGLAAANFTVTALIVGPGGALVNISSVTSSGGFYIVRVVPIAGQTWKSGVYIFGVAVTRGSDHGQSLCSVLMD